MNLSFGTKHDRLMTDNFFIYFWSLSMVKNISNLSFFTIKRLLYNMCPYYKISTYNHNGNFSLEQSAIESNPGRSFKYIFIV